MIPTSLSGHKYESILARTGQTCGYWLRYFMVIVSQKKLGGNQMS